MTTATTRPAVAIDRVFEDPSIVYRLIDAHQPYQPVQRYMANRAEYATLAGGSAGHDPEGAVPVAPIFRGDWAYGGEVLEGVGPLLHHEPFIAAARTVFEAEIVRPHTVYVNLTWQIPFAQGRGHVDIPAFRGFDRSTIPVTFLTILGLSGLFEEERVKVATAVAWFYEGTDGGFEYWPDGPENGSVIHEGAINNTAIVGDNDFMWHRVRPVGRPEDGMVSLDLDSTLERAGANWKILKDGASVANFGDDRLRVSLSWKADVFVDAAEARRLDDHTDDLTLDAVLTRIEEDLTSRDLDASIPAVDPLRHPEFIARLQGAYMRYPA